MSDDIQFGDLEHTQPHCALRPDENRQYVVTPVGRIQETDLPIFIDLDVHAEMDGHAASDTSVELGGVLLGRACHDEHGQPFVVVADCIAAKHYESTKGSFKFTHETWAAITRERQRTTPDLAIVGWYHTHPGWGVFLSGMDLFICENFFNKPFDIAYVIDPCRHERGMFQWTDAASPDDNRAVRPTGGYYLFASRFRSTELHTYLAELTTMPAAKPNRPPETLAWQTLAILGMLTAQLLLIVVLAWKTLVPSQNNTSAHDRAIAITADKLTAALSTLEERRRLDLAEERLKARSEFLDQAFRELKNADDNAISRLQSRFDHTARLTDDVEARDAQLRELQTQLNDSHDKILGLEVSAKRNEERLTSLNDSLRAENAKLAVGQASSLPLKPEASTSNAAGIPSSWWWLAGSAVAIAALLAISRHLIVRTHPSNNLIAT